jgi:hypothetical protein
VEEGAESGKEEQAGLTLMPFETFQLLLDVAEDLAIGQHIRERETSDTGNRTSLAEAAAEFGIDLDEL